MKLSEAVAGYVDHKQAMGMRFRTEARILRSFCRASGEVTTQEVSASQVLAFLAGGMQRFARSVNHPGSTLPARAYLHTSLEEARDEIVDALSTAATEAWDKP